jgi:hypothetical protein
MRNPCLTSRILEKDKESFPVSPFLYSAMLLTPSRFCAVLMLLMAAMAFSPGHAQEAEASGSAAPSANSGETDAPKPAAKKKAKKSSADFKKKHAKKKKSKPPPVKDASVSEPTEDIQAIKNRAEKRFWEGKNKDAKSGSAADPRGALERASSSQLAGVTFDDQPVRMPESEAFRRPMDTVAQELGRPCFAREYLGWPLQQTEQARVDRIFGETVEKFRQRGYNVFPHTPKSASEDISVFTADLTSGGFDRHILGMWTAGDAGLLLMLCETEARTGTAKKETAKAKQAKTAAKKAAPKKAAAKKSPARKPAAPKVAAPKPDPTAEQAPSLAATPAPEDGRPVVMPGVAPAE